VRSWWRGSSRASVKARVSPMRSSNWRMGSSPASLESWPCDGSMTSGVPKKFRTCGNVDGTLIDGLLDCGEGLARQQVRRLGRAKIPGPAPGVGRGCSSEILALSVSLMTEVTRILSAIEQGDEVPHDP